jgi:hypothetical protein
LFFPWRLLYRRKTAFSAARAGTVAKGVMWSAGPDPSAVGTSRTWRKGTKSCLTEAT